MKLERKGGGTKSVASTHHATTERSLTTVRLTNNRLAYSGQVASAKLPLTQYGIDDALFGNNANGYLPKYELIEDVGAVPIYQSRRRACHKTGHSYMFWLTVGCRNIDSHYSTPRSKRAFSLGTLPRLVTTLFRDQFDWLVLNCAVRSSPEVPRCSRNGYYSRKSPGSDQAHWNFQLPNVKRW